MEPADLGPRRPSGFTLVELLVVVAVIGLVLRIALLNLGAMVPSTILDGESKMLRSHLDYLRSEARLRGQAHALELDLSSNRYRYVLPTERRLTSDQEEIAELPLGWTALDERARFDGVASPGRPRLDKGRYSIVFDENGNTADLALFLRLKDPGDERVWSLQIRGLTGRTDIKKSIEGVHEALDEVGEGAF